MYIESVQISNYRSFGVNDVRFTFDVGLNTIIGENNAGKSNLNHAILQLLPLNLHEYKKPIEDDFHNRNTEHPLRIQLRAHMHETDMSFLLEEMKIPVSLKEDFFNLFGYGLSFDFEYSYSQNLVTTYIQIGNIIISKRSEGRLANSNPTSNDQRPWTEYIQNAVEKIKSLKDQAEEHRNTWIAFGIDIESLVGKLLCSSIISFPEFRQRPLKGERGHITSTSGVALSDILYKLKNSRSLLERNRFKQIQAYFYELFSLKLDVIEDQEIVFADENNNEVSHQSI
jgi:AAA ATPase domain